MKHLFRFGLCALLLITLVLTTTTSVFAQLPDQNTHEDTDELDCRECHWEVYIDWEQSIHGQGLSCGQCHLADQQNHAREGHGAQGGAQQCMSCHTTGYNPEDDTWEEDNIHCKACHYPIDPQHPDVPVPTNREVDLCGSCHIQANFEWQVSIHREAGVACVDCHSQHKTSLKSGDVMDQCATCHESRVLEFQSSKHNLAGVTCSNCHLAPLDGPIGEGSAKLNHTFIVELRTCTACHLEQMHTGNDSHASTHDVTLVSLDAMSSMADAKVEAEPPPTNLIGFAVFFGVAGVGFSMIRTPIFNRMVRKKVK